MNSMKRQKDMTLEDKPLRSKGVQYATREDWRAITNATERMKWLGQSRNNGLVVKVKSSAVKNKNA